MKCSLLLVLLCSFGALDGQIIDNFSDNNLLNNPEWKGDVFKFTTESEALRSNNQVVNDQFYISTASIYALDAQWELDITLLFSTSSKNYVSYFLMSDSSNLDATQNGYYLSLGGTKDKITFNKIEEGLTTELYSTAEGTIKSSSNSNLKIIRDKDTIFYLYIDYHGNKNYDLEASFKDASVPVSQASGIVINQSTASFFNKHYFDNFYAGPIVYDTEPPVLSGLNQLDLNTLKLSFNEDLDSTSAISLSNYVLNKSIGSPYSIGIANKRSVELSFSNPMGNPENYILSITGIMDVAGNVLDTNASFTSFKALEPGLHDLLITEILPIPDPPVYLPLGQFIEIYNNTLFPISLKNVEIGDRTTSKLIGDYNLLKHDYAILCNALDSPAYAKIGKVIPINSLPSLNKTEDRLRLLSTSGEVIHEVDYNTVVYPSEKSSGWTMEMIDVLNPCHFYGNWQPSKDNKGGTPGYENSVKARNLDIINPKLERIYPINEKTLGLFFSEPLKGTDFKREANFRILETEAYPDSISKTDSLTKFALHFENSFKTNQIYSLEYWDGKDCAGNRLELDTQFFGLAKEFKKGDLLFNEILYEPFEGGAEFVELYNNTSQYLDLKNLKIGLKVGGVYEKVNFVSEGGSLIAPMSLVVLTKSPDLISSFYNNKDTTMFFETSAMPSLSNSGATIVLLNRLNEEIDVVGYDPDWHYEIVNEAKGVSLERINVEIPSTSHNWTSAGSNAGYATPGKMNSQAFKPIKSRAKIELEHKSFSPNGDGNKDLLIINYKMDSPNTTTNVYVFNDNGTLIKQIANNETLASSGFISWDGEREEGGKANVGIYVILFEYFTPDGRVEKKKLSCALLWE